MPKGPVPEKYRDILESTTLGHLATVDEEGRPNEACLARFRRAICSARLDAVFLTEHDRRMVEGVAEREIAAGENIQAQGGEVAVGDRLDGGDRLGACVNRWLTLDLVSTVLGSLQTIARGEGSVGEMRVGAQR